MSTAQNWRNGKGSALPDRLRKLDARVAAAIAKRDAGETLTRHERWLLSFEDLNFTPETAAAILFDVAARGGRGSVARVSAVERMVRICGDEADAKVQHEHKVTLDLAGLHDRLREAGGDAAPLEGGPGAVLPGIPGVDAVGEASGSDAGDCAPPEPRGRDGRNGDGARRG